MLDKEIQSEYGPFNLEIDLNTPYLSYRIRFAMELWDHWRDEANSQERTENQQHPVRPNRS